MVLGVEGGFGPEVFNCSSMVASSGERIKGAGLSQGGRGPGEGGNPPRDGKYKGNANLSLSFFPKNKKKKKI